MDGPRYPCLLISGCTLLVLDFEAALQRVVGLSTDKAIREGFYRRAVIVDADLRLFRFGEVRLRGKFRLGGWMRSERAVERCELLDAGKIHLDEAKSKVLASIEGASEEVVRAIAEASDLSALWFVLMSYRLD